MQAVYILYPASLLTWNGMQGLCDEHGTKLLHRFAQHRKLAQMLQQSSQHGGSPRVKGAAEETPILDPRQVPTPSVLQSVQARGSWLSVL